MYELANIDDVNQLNFLHQGKYVFQMKDIETVELLDVNARHFVKKCRHVPSNKILAVKYINIPQSRFQGPIFESNIKTLKREIENIYALQGSPYIVYFYGLCLHEGQALLCMELMDLSLRELYLMIHKSLNHDQYFFEKLVTSVFVRTVSALAYCKEKGIIHRDIKPNNILVNYSGEIKLCDFGESRIVENSVASTHVGTIAYWPPEHFTNAHQKYDSRTDIWSLGITLLEIILGKLPYYHSEKLNKKESDGSLSITQLIVSIDFEYVIDTFIRTRNYSHGLCTMLIGCTRKLEERSKLVDLVKTQVYEENKDVTNQEVKEIISKLINRP